MTSERRAKRVPLRDLTNAFHQKEPIGKPTAVEDVTYKNRTPRETGEREHGVNSLQKMQEGKIGQQSSLGDPNELNWTLAHEDYNGIVFCFFFVFGDWKKVFFCGETTKQEKPNDAKKQRNSVLKKGIDPYFFGNATMNDNTNSFPASNYQSAIADDHVAPTAYSSGSKVGREARTSTAQKLSMARYPIKQVFVSGVKYSGVNICGVCDITNDEIALKHDCNDMWRQEYEAVVARLNHKTENIVGMYTCYNSSENLWYTQKDILYLFHKLRKEKKKRAKSCILKHNKYTWYDMFSQGLTKKNCPNNNSKNRLYVFVWFAVFVGSLNQLLFCP
ncbi:hypothetical protein RFI_24732 [Reticulomyxa filosa]|uniref:Uncharacterized protein n=1 Tax=Reticulomyxa filosa TaxID=46433 RepID=X6MHV1_RETFI|nr:hypothetical protein RFI_24732 [Reticulomyxa filosa]|eukprot:ETO12645.1 hypothetical protein RFI_24732 [Reticulomyxa filosa]